MKPYWLACLLLVVLSIPVFAEETDIVKPVHPFDTYLTRVDKKFDRGALNTIMGMSEIVNEPAENYKKTEGKKRWLHAAGGIGTGAVYGVLNTVGGAFNLLTALVPQAEVPLPQGGVQAKTITGGDPEIFFEERAKHIRAQSNRLE